MAETILSHWIFTNFAFPFLLMFFIVFAILQKTKLLDGKKQLDALTAFVIALIFVSAVSPKIIVSNLILFLTIAIVVVFIVLLLWGFVSGDAPKVSGGWAKIVAAVLIGGATLVALLWATGLYDETVSYLFRQSWSSTFWTNALFIVMIGVALALAIKSK